MSLLFSLTNFQLRSRQDFIMQYKLVSVSQSPNLILQLLGLPTSVPCLNNFYSIHYFHKRHIQMEIKSRTALVCITLTFFQWEKDNFIPLIVYNIIFDYHFLKVRVQNVLSQSQSDFNVIQMDQPVNHRSLYYQVSQHHV